MKAPDSPQAKESGKSAEPPTEPHANPPTVLPTEPPTYFSTDPYLIPSREHPALGPALVPHDLASTRPRGVPEVHNRSGQGSLARWTRDGVSNIPGGREGYVSTTDVADDNPPPYSEIPEKGDDRDIQKDQRKGDDSWRREYKAGDKRPRDYDQGDDIGEDDRKEPPKKIRAKVDIACYFCRYRKLKCSGSRPSCFNCTKNGKDCNYDDKRRHRGPGRKNKDLSPRPRGRQRERDEPPEVSTSMSTPSSFTFQHQPASAYHSPTPLPGPPIPQYNYDLGQIQSSVRLIAGTPSRSGEPSGSRGPRRFDDSQLYPQPEYRRSPERRDYAQQPRQEQYHHRLTIHEHRRSQTSHLYRDEYPQASTSQIDNFYGGPSAESHSAHPSEAGDNEGTSRPRRLKRKRVPSPPEDIGPSNPKQRRYYDPDEDGR